MGADDADFGNISAWNSPPPRVVRGGITSSPIPLRVDPSVSAAVADECGAVRSNRRSKALSASSGPAYPDPDGYGNAAFSELRAGVWRHRCREQLRRDYHRLRAQPWRAHAIQSLRIFRIGIGSSQWGEPGGPHTILCRPGDGAYRIADLFHRVYPNRAARCGRQQPASVDLNRKPLFAEQPHRQSLPRDRPELGPPTACRHL
jgi:hypothetical protein